MLCSPGLCGRLRGAGDLGAEEVVGLPLVTVHCCHQSSGPAQSPGRGSQSAVRSPQVTLVFVLFHVSNFLYQLCITIITGAGGGGGPKRIRKKTASHVYLNYGWNEAFGALRDAGEVSRWTELGHVLTSGVPLPDYRQVNRIYQKERSGAFTPKQQSRVLWMEQNLDQPERGHRFSHPLHTAASASQHPSPEAQGVGGLLESSKRLCGHCILSRGHQGTGAEGGSTKQGPL